MIVVTFILNTSNKYHCFLSKNKLTFLASHNSSAIAELVYQQGFSQADLQELETLVIDGDTDGAYSLEVGRSLSMLSYPWKRRYV